MAGNGVDGWKIIVCRGAVAVRAEDRSPISDIEDVDIVHNVKTVRQHIYGRHPREENVVTGGHYSQIKHRREPIWTGSWWINSVCMLAIWDTNLSYTVPLTVKVAFLLSSSNILPISPATHWNFVSLYILLTLMVSMPIISRPIRTSSVKISLRGVRAELYLFSRIPFNFQYKMLALSALHVNVALL